MKIVNKSSIIIPIALYLAIIAIVLVLLAQSNGA